ncbi:15-hydroxyprostaglandin dehydrogenase, partial [Caerostris darwini]
SECPTFRNNNDLGNIEAFDKTIATFGTLDVLINNAGMFNETKYQDMININFIAVVRGTLLAFEHMNKLTGGKGGYVINTSSEAGLDPFPMAPVYTATKHAVVGLTKSLGSDYHFEKTGITVNVICPGPVETAFFKAFPSNCVYPEEAWKLQASMKPIKPEDVAKALLKLLEDNKNGAVLRIDTDGLRYV